MIDKLPSLARLIRILQQVPYLASKNVYRVAEHFLQLEETQIQSFCTLLQETCKSLKRCPDCFCWYEKLSGCLFCNSSSRNERIICVVETWLDVLAIEKTNGYVGVYHVLCGVIFPLEGVGPDDLTIARLIERITSGQVEEVILATNQTPEGEATAAFIAKKLKDVGFYAISCLARGVPVGGFLETMDRLTVCKAIRERRPF